MDQTDKAPARDTMRQILLYCAFFATFMAGATLAILSGNSAGGFAVFLVCCGLFTISGRYCKVPDRILLPIGILIWIVGSFVFLGTEMKRAVFLKNGVQLRSPFLVIPLYDNIEPMVQWVEVAVSHKSTIHSFEPSKVEPRTVTIHASVTAKSRDGELFVLDETKLYDEVKGRIRNMFVSGNDVDGYSKVAAQSLREGLEKEFPKLKFTGTLHIAYSGSAHSKL